MSWFYPFDRDRDYDTAERSPLDLTATATKSLLAALAVSSHAFDLRCRAKGCGITAESVVTIARGTPRPFCARHAGDVLATNNAREYPIDAFMPCSKHPPTFGPTATSDLGTTVELSAADDGNAEAWVAATNYAREDSESVVDLGGEC